MVAMSRKNAGSTADAENLPDSESGRRHDGRSWYDIRLELLTRHPDHVTLKEAASLLGITRRAVELYHRDSLGTPLVDMGITLYPRDAVIRYAQNRRRRNSRHTAMTFRGIEVERLQRICENYYRRNLDVGDPELVRLAKRVAKL